MQKMPEAQLHGNMTCPLNLTHRRKQDYKTLKAQSQISQSESLAAGHAVSKVGCAYELGGVGVAKRCT